MAESRRLPPWRTVKKLRTSLGRTANKAMGEGFFNGLSRVGRMHPQAQPERHNVEVIRDIPYLRTGSPDHRLDIYRPTRHPAPYPVVLYIHGGGFHLLSKDTHWVMGLAFARHGYLVVNISYRLAPRHPFPAAVEDACAALAWVAQNVASYGGDPDRIVLAGESAGGNLVAALTVATCYRRPERFARDAFELGVVPRATIPACAILQVTDPDRFARRKPDLPGWVDTVLQNVSGAYLRGLQPSWSRELDLADPLLVFERGEPPDRALPPFFVPVGTRDPLLDDTRRLERALSAMGVPCEARYYEGEIHAFHAMVWRRAARRCWRDTFAFLDRALRAPRALPLEEQGGGMAASG